MDQLIKEMGNIRIQFQDMSKLPLKTNINVLFKRKYSPYAYL